MKVISLATLLALAVAAFPLVPPCPGQGSPVTSLMVLDVCSASSSAVHASVDFPFMCENAVKLVPAKSAILQEASCLSLASSLFTFRVEPPPEF